MLLAEKIQLNKKNKSVLRLLNIKSLTEKVIIHRSNQNTYTTEGIEDFWSMKVAEKYKYLIAGHAVLLEPDSGEIFAFEFGFGNCAFKITTPEKKLDIGFKHIKEGLRKNFKFNAARKVCLRYFSNIYNDPDTIIDFRSLEKCWVLGIYYIGEQENSINDYIINGL